MKKNSAENYESILIKLSEEKFPIAFNAKVEELVSTGAFDSEEEAKAYVRTTPIELELYYSPNLGLFGVESDAVECTEIYDPYTGEVMEECDED